MLMGERKVSPEELRRSITKPVCFLCLLDVAIKTIDLSTPDEEKKFKAIKRVLAILHDRFDEMVMDRPAWIATELYWEIADVTGNPDPYKVLKEESNRMGMAVAAKVEEDVFSEKDVYKRLYKAVAAAITGNVIDYGSALHKFDLNQLTGIYKEILERGFAVNNLSLLLKKIKESRIVLYIGDNAGETAFDRILVRFLVEMGLKVYYAAKDAPISNDATVEDARYVGIDKYAEIISTGNNILGVDFRRMSRKFIEVYRSCDFVIAKGQSNYETFTHFIGRLEKPVFLILRVKCPPIAEHIGLSVGDNVVLKIQ